MIGGVYYGGAEVVGENGDGNGGLEEEILQVFPQNGDFQKIHSVFCGDRFGLSAVAFDTQEELLWIGNQGGHVSSFYGPNMEKYTSFQVANQEIRQILTLDDIVLILSQSQLRGQIRRGIPVFTHLSENLLDMQCMLKTSPNTLLIGGHQEILVDFDLIQNAEIRTIPIGEGGCAILRTHGRYLCAGQATGSIHLLDPRTIAPEQNLSIEVHSGSLSDFDVHGNFIVTCGFSSSRHGNLTVDRFLQMYDVRMLRALAPIPVSLDPYLLRFLPSFSSRIAAVSSSGQMEILETQALTTANISLYQVTANGAMCNTFDVSSSCHHISFGDSDDSLHLFTSNPSAMFNTFSRSTEFADPIEPIEPMSITDEFACYASIPLPLTNTPLLSDWPQEYCQRVYRRTPDIDRRIIQSMKMVGTIGYAPNPGGTFKRNQVQYKVDSLSPSASVGGFADKISPTSASGTFNHHSPNANSKHFTSPHHHSQHLHSGSSPGASGGHLIKGPGGAIPPYHAKRNYRYHIPKRYAKIEWKKSYFEESDIEAFNKTKLAGLEAATVNSYCNSMLQVLYHLEFVRTSLLSHICKKDACLSCELGFLFHMLDQSKNYPCLASNFLRAFRVVPEGLILQESQSKQRSVFLRLIQSWNRFILHQLETENGKEQKGLDSISKLFAMPQDNTNRCTRCGREEKKESTVLLSNLLYTHDVTNGGMRCNFVDILQRSLCPEQTTPAWCDRCEKYQSTFQNRVPKSLPAIFSVNTCLDNATDNQTWKYGLESILPERPSATKAEGGSAETSPTQTVSTPVLVPHKKSCRYGRNCMRPDCKFFHEGRNEVIGKITEFEISPETQVKWLPSEIRLGIEDNREVKVTNLETTDLDAIPDERYNNNLEADYELFAVVCFVRDPEAEEKNNLVVLIHIDESYFNRVGDTSKSGWYLFNDMSVREVAASEAFSFNPKWKIPCVIYYRKNPMHPNLEHLGVIKQTVTVDAFKEIRTNNKKVVTHKPLDAAEIPEKGQLVAMDAEFVTLGQEETELRSDGKLATVKPQQLTVGRVTCIRGQGPLEGTPFLDDYISTQEVVVDYLTKFSGIQPGDLDANFSSKNVKLLKSVYLKLRYLIDSGVKFVGHGLNNDFRVINLVVPPDQIIDTVNLFHLPNQRMVSLRFLAWHFLNVVIQSEMHDSTEDARAALLLYRKYEELKSDDSLEKALEELYEAGKKAQWKVPHEGNKLPAMNTSKLSLKH